MALRMATVRVVPMKMPSSMKLQTETMGVSTSQGRYASAVARTSVIPVMAPTMADPNPA